MKQLKKRPRIVLLDAHAIIHRAYHALPEFTSSSGEPTGALFGLSSMMIKIIQDLKPEYIVACIDLPDKTHRHDIYEEYKGTRAKTDNALVAQLMQAPRVFEAFGIPVYSAKGFEADDCLGTIVAQLKQEPLDIVIASGDLDTLQLVSGDRVQVLTLRKGLSDTVMYDERAVFERYGFGPALIPDYKGLRGDPSDNIKGVKGIGEKAATELVQKIGTIEAIYKALSREETLLKKGFKPRVIELLREGEDDAVFSKLLATIRTDAPITFTLPKKQWTESIHHDALFGLFDELEFRSLSARARALFSATAALPIQTETVTEAHDIQTSKEACVALWVLSSDMTNPTIEDVFRFTKTQKLTEAHRILMEQLRHTGRLLDVFNTIERPLIAITERMHADGVGVDTEALSILSKKYHEVLDRTSKKIYELAGHEFNINSPKQLGAVLFDELHITPKRQKKTSTGQRSTREEELQKLKDDHPIITEILAYRELHKLVSTYIDALPRYVVRGRLHAEFLQTGAATGRMASQNPGLQNIPIKGEYGKEIRDAFVARPGSLLVALDYSQIELRIAAGLSHDTVLMNVFKEGGDVHQSVAAAVFQVVPEMVTKEMRRRAKVINFGILYGMGVNALRSALGEGVSREEAAHFLSEYFKKFPGLARYVDETKRRAAEQGYTETFFGRRRYFGGFSSPLPHIQAAAERMAINAPIQGTQADIIKLAMVRADEWIEEKKLRDDIKLVLQIHDELVYEVTETRKEEAISTIREIMESVVSESVLGVPIKVDCMVGRQWGTMERY